MAEQPLSAESSNRFPTTTWKLIRLAQQPEKTDFKIALNQVFKAYWKPVFYFLLAKGYEWNAAQDLTQEFFYQLLHRDWLRRANPGRGRFRNFLLKILVRFLSDMGPKRAPRQARHEKQMLALDALLTRDDKAFQPADHETPESIFMKQWALALVHQVLQRVREFYEQEGKLDWHAVFVASQFADGDERMSEKELGARFKMSRDQVRYAVKVVGQRFKHFLREEVREQVGAEEDVGEEVRTLLKFLEKK